MAKVEADMGMFATHQTDKLSLNDYYKLFKAQVEVIYANGGAAGYNPELFKNHLARILVKKDPTVDDLRTGPQTTRNGIHAGTQNARRGLRRTTF